MLCIMRRSRLRRVLATVALAWHRSSYRSGPDVVVVDAYLSPSQSLGPKRPIFVQSKHLHAMNEEPMSFQIRQRLSREDAQLLMEETLLPRSEYGDRLGLGRDAQGLTSTGAILRTDPRLDKTYGEFPLSSMDQLFDLGIGYLEDSKDREHITMVDIGSGFSRLVLYSGLTRGSNQQIWDIHGIEIADLLHQNALDAAERGVEGGWMQNDPDASPAGRKNNRIHLHNGPAGSFPSILGKADLLFAYSTAFSSSHFSPEVGALLLGPEWSQLLGNACRQGCIAITTDRALDPAYGWKVVDRLDVDNKEVFGSTGFIHVRT
jgi:hypothetical protein